MNFAGAIVALMVALARALPAIERILTRAHDEIVIRRARSARDADVERLRERVRDAAGESGVWGEDEGPDGRPGV